MENEESKEKDVLPVDRVCKESKEKDDLPVATVCFRVKRDFDLNKLFFYDEGELHPDIAIEEAILEMLKIYLSHSF